MAASGRRQRFEPLSSDPVGIPEVAQVDASEAFRCSPGTGLKGSHLG